MKTFAMIATLLCIGAGSVMAGETGAAGTAMHNPAVILPADVAARVAELRAHGDRFEAAIRAIERAAMMPAWGWDDCGHETSQAEVAFPES